MPKYTNTTSQDISAGGHLVPAKESITIAEYIQSLPAGITENTTVGYIDPILLSQKVTSTSTVTVPATTSAYEVKLVCSAGDATIKFNSDSATGKLIVSGETYSYRCFTRVIDDVRFTITSGTVYMTVSKI